jgi:pseudouridine synthase
VSEQEGGERLQKALARAGVASRRAAEELIAAGRVRVNGQVVTEMGRRVLPTDRLEVGGRQLAGPAPPVYLAVNKPTGYVTTARDPEGRPTVFELIRSAARVYPVGRLDWDSEGLLLLTNDGELTHRLTHPRYGVEKEYHALVEGHPNQITVDRLAAGVRLSDGPTAPARARRLRPTQIGDWVAVTIHEGRNRQVRRMLEAVGHPVRRLLRVRVGPIELGALGRGQARELSRQEVAALRRLVGLDAPLAPAPRTRGARPALAPQTRGRGDAGTRGAPPRPSFRPHPFASLRAGSGPLPEGEGTRQERRR